MTVPMTFRDALVKAAANKPAGAAAAGPLTFSSALEKAAHFRLPTGQFRAGKPVALATLADIEAAVPEDDEGFLDAVEKYKAGEVPPPIDIAVDPEGNMQLVRGKKRLAAARATGQDTIPVRFTEVKEVFGKADTGGASATATSPPRALQPIDDKTSYPPFPYDQTVFARIRPDQVPRFLGVLTDRDRWPLKTVKLSDLLAMQNRVDTGKVQAKVANGGGGHQPIVVMLEPGRLHIADGHHDLAAAWLRGEDVKEVRFADLTAVTNVLKADMPVAPGTKVRVKEEHRADNWFLERVGDAVGEVIASWVVTEGDNAGVTALAVEWLTPGISGLYRGLDAAKVEVVNWADHWYAWSSECDRIAREQYGWDEPDCIFGATPVAQALCCNGVTPADAMLRLYGEPGPRVWGSYVGNLPQATMPDASIAKAAAQLPAVGDLIDFDDDRFTDKGPASGTVAAVIRNSVIIDFGDGTPEDLEVIDWRHVTRNAKADRWTKPSGKVVWSVHGKPDDQPPADGGVSKTATTTPAGQAFTLSAEICKVDQDQRLVFGWFSIVEVDGKPVTDRENDRIAPAELEKAAYGHVLNARIASDTHTRIGVGDLVESCVFTVEKQKAMVAALIALGIPAVLDLHCVGWWGGYHITDDAVWAEVKAGNYVSFSIGGSGTRTPAAA